MNTCDGDNSSILIINQKSANKPDFIYICKVSDLWDKIMEETGHKMNVRLTEMTCRLGEKWKSKQARLFSSERRLSCVIMSAKNVKRCLLNKQRFICHWISLYFHLSHLLTIQSLSNELISQLMLLCLWVFHCHSVNKTSSLKKWVCQISDEEDEERWRNRCKHLMNLNWFKLKMKYKILTDAL